MKKRNSTTKNRSTFFELVDNETKVEEDPYFIESEVTGKTFIDFKHLIFKAEDNKNDKIEDILVFAEEMPQFPGGDKALLKFLGNSVKYPVIAQEKGIEGKYM